MVVRKQVSETIRNMVENPKPLILEDSDLNKPKILLWLEKNYPDKKFKYKIIPNPRYNDEYELLPIGNTLVVYVKVGWFKWKKVDLKAMELSDKLGEPHVIDLHV